MQGHYILANKPARSWSRRVCKAIQQNMKEFIIKLNYYSSTILLVLALLFVVFKIFHKPRNTKRINTRIERKVPKKIKHKETSSPRYKIRLSDLPPITVEQMREAERRHDSDPFVIILFIILLIFLFFIRLVYKLFLGCIEIVAYQGGDFLGPYTEFAGGGFAVFTMLFFHALFYFYGFSVFDVARTASAEDAVFIFAISLSFIAYLFGIKYRMLFVHVGALLYLLACFMFVVELFL